MQKINLKHWKILLILCCVFALCGCSGTKTSTPEEPLKTTDKRIAMIVENSGSNYSYAEPVKEAFAKFAKHLEIYDSSAKPEEICNPENFDMVVLLGSDSAKIGLMSAVYEYMQNKGKLMIIGGPTLNKIDFASVTGDAMTDEMRQMWQNDIQVMTLLPMDTTTALYPITNAAELSSAPGQAIVQEASYTVPNNLFSCSPGRQGTGYNKGRTDRFIPLIEVSDENGLHSGYAAWLNIYSSTEGGKNGAFEGSMCAVYSSNDAAFYDDAGTRAVIDTASAMLNPAYLLEGGTEEYLYVADDTDTIVLGSQIYCDAENSSDVTVSITLYKEEKELYRCKTSLTSLEKKENGVYSFSDVYDISNSTTEEYPDKAVTTLEYCGEIVDCLEHEICIWSPKPESERHYVYTENGNFMRDGEPITFFGVNYMPTYGIAEEDTELFEYYVSSASYDPDVIKKDLAHVKDIGFNAIAIFVYYDTMMESNNILHLLHLCEEMELYVDLSIRPAAYPFAYDAQQVQTMLTKLHFSELDHIIAYDIAWEPQVGDENGDALGYAGIRPELNTLWQQWLIEQFGSVQEAEQICGVALPRDASGNVTGALDSYLEASEYTESGLKIAAIYRRFLDDAISRQFNEAVQHLKGLDPNHLISFRMQNAGVSVYCYDFQSLATTLDFMSPEGYSLNEGNPYNVLFVNAYARYTNPDKPVVWKEFGTNIWNGSNFNTMPQSSWADFYEEVLSAMLAGKSNAVYCWYFPGGFRCGENSDYGILNPDGSDRPQTTVLRKYAELFFNMEAYDVKDISVSISLERDDFQNSVVGMSKNSLESIIKAVISDQSFAGFINHLQASSADTVYAEETLEYGVGGINPQGKYPLRYVNGQILNCKVLEEDDCKYLQVTVCNAKDATWRENTVSIVSTKESDIQIKYTLPEELSYLEQTTVKIPLKDNDKGIVQLKFEIDGISFGWAYETAVE